MFYIYNEVHVDMAGQEFLPSMTKVVVKQPLLKFNTFKSIGLENLKELAAYLGVTLYKYWKIKSKIKIKPKKLPPLFNNYLSFMNWSTLQGGGGEGY